MARSALRIDDYVLQRLKREHLLRRLLEAVLLDFVPEPAGRVHRGAVARAVAQRLDLVVNNRLCQDIAVAIKQRLGLKPVKSHGWPCWRGLAHRTPT